MLRSSKTGLKLLIPLVLLLILVGCNAKKNNLSDFKALEGTWISSDKSGEFIEKWSTIEATEMVGTSYMVLKGDTIFSEVMKLIIEKDSVYYCPLVTGENNGKAIRFKLTSKSTRKWIFENKTHDFPQQIIYQFKGNDSLIAIVQGNEDNRFRKLEFRMRRSN
jgi:hypothetical protein